MVLSRFLRIALPSLLSFVALLAPSAVCAEAARRLSRTADPLEIPGEVLPGALGASFHSIHVSALRERRWVGIPSQVDERSGVRNESGEAILDYVFPNGVLAAQDDDPAFDTNDLLVILAGDMGDRAVEGDWPREVVPAHEIEVTDPRDGSKGWAYVFVGKTPADPPPEHYVSYRPDESILEGSRYRIRLCPENPILYDQLVLKGRADEQGLGERNVIDRFKMRAEASVVVPFFRFRRNESDLWSRTVGWIEGPVRVIRRMETRVDLLWGFSTPVQVQDTIFYPDQFFFWVDLTPPVALNRLTTHAEVRLSADMNERAVGMLFVSRLNPLGFLVDGVMSEQELGVRKEAQDWYAVSDGIDTLFSRLILPRGTPVLLELQYMDDRRLPDPPETVSGRWGDAGYRLSGLESVAKGRYRLLIHTMIGGAYRPGGERAFLDITDRPLSWTCRLPAHRPRSGGSSAREVSPEE